MQIYNCNEIENIDVESIRDSIKENAYSVIRGLFDETEIIKKRNFIEKSFNHIKDIKHDPKEVHLAKQNIQKIVIGNAEGVWRFYRKFYNPLFNDDIYEMHDVFKLLIKLRNKLSYRDQSFTLDNKDDKYWTCPMITQYPTGGGFMEAHRDFVSSALANDMGISFIRLIFIMSQKGSDFQTGGAYITHKGKKIFVEDNCKPGDVLLYDGNTRHGVDVIDSLKMLDLTSPKGRYNAMVPVFREFSSSKDRDDFNTRYLNQKK
tara:strand:+ start:669 stop:1451 length:783 start_codon:yes stop_codon:yes gene_type:complete